MSMHMIRGVQVHGRSKNKKKALTEAQLQKMQVEWRQYNKRMRKQHNHSLQFSEFNDYVSYIRGEYKPKTKKEFVPYVPSESNVRNTTQYPSLTIKTSDTVPGAGRKRENPKYTGDLIVGIATMHKSNAVPVMRGTNEATDIARMAK